MIVVFDTNVVLDVWLAREPFWADSAAALALAENAQVSGMLCPTTVTTLHYLSKKVLGEATARKLVTGLLTMISLGELGAASFALALKSKIVDFEDAVIEAVALQSKADCIVTRNLRDFAKSRIRAIEPKVLLDEMAAN